MPNISTTNTNDLYKYVASMTLVFDEEDPIELDMVYIKGLVIDYRFEDYNFPIIYATVAFDETTRQLMEENQQTGTIIFRLQKYISNGDNPDLKIDCFEDKFIYVLPASASSATEEREVTKEVRRESEDLVDTYTIGLAKLDHVNESKRSINMVVKNASVSSLIYYILREHQLLIEPITYNSKISYVEFPPKNSVSKALGFLNKLNAFYDTNYRFFMDFDMTYLLSSSTKITKRKTEKYIDVIINVRKQYDEANMEGMITNDDIQAYVINVASSNCVLSDANMSNKSFNQFAGSTTAGRTSDIITIIDFSGTELTNKKTHVRLPNNNTNYLTNMEKSTKLHDVAISISTTKIDSTIFTMNKRYNLYMDDTFGSEYNGQYLLSAKRDVYAPEGEGFNITTTMTFNRIPDQEDENGLL